MYRLLFRRLLVKLLLPLLCKRVLIFACIRTSISLIVCKSYLIQVQSDKLLIIDCVETIFFWFISARSCLKLKLTYYIVVIMAEFCFFSYFIVCSISFASLRPQTLCCFCLTTSEQFSAISQREQITKNVLFNC